MSKQAKSGIVKIVLGVLMLLAIYVYNNYLEEPINKLFDDIGEVDEVNNTQPVSVERKLDDLTIRFVDVGQADCILISQNGHNMLIDAGNNEDGNKIVTYFKSLGIEKFDYVIGTHAHEDHIGGMDNVLKNFEIETFYMPDVITTTRTFEEVLDVLEEKQIVFEIPEIDSKFKLEDVEFTVLYVGNSSSDLNDSSIVLKADYGDNSFLFTGDATSKVEKEILEKDIDVDLLKVGHHGSQYSSSATFLKKVTPDYAVIQVGKNNTYNHPKDIIINRLEKMNTKIYRTDNDGTIIVKSNGNKLTFTTEETDTNG